MRISSENQRAESLGAIPCVAAVSRLLPERIVSTADSAVRHVRDERKKPKCPQCDKRLATDKAQQCFGCALRWHGLPKPDNRSPEFANHSRENYGPAWLEMAHRFKRNMRFTSRMDWDHCVWKIIQERWREEDAWLRAAVGSSDVEALKALIDSRQFNEPIIGISRIAEAELEIRLGLVAGPLMGCGHTILVRRGAVGWRIESEYSWTS